MSARPLGRRIRDDVEAQILSGAWPPGHRIPAEAELMIHYGCSRMTISKALSGLVAAGLIERRKGAGSHVARPRTQSMVLDVPDLAAVTVARGQRYGWRLIERTFGHAGAEQRQALAGARLVLAIEGVHLADGEPFAFERRLINASAIPAVADADFSAEAPGTWLLGHVPWTEAENRIAAIGAEPGVATALQVDAGAPCLRVSRRTWREGHTITFVEQMFVADSYELVARFGAGGVE